MIKWLILFFIPMSVFGQVDTSNCSLTKKFSTLKSKDRVRISNEESVNEKLDSVYIGLMFEGDSLFLSKQYILSLEKYKLARVRRPYNVNPKVRISDITPLVEYQIELNRLRSIQDSLGLFEKKKLEFTERKFKDGGFYISERTMIIGGDIYRKSVGKNIYYFKNDKSITKREWDSVFKK